MLADLWILSLSEVGRIVQGRIDFWGEGMVKIMGLEIIVGPIRRLELFGYFWVNESWNFCHFCKRRCREDTCKMSR